MLVGMRRLVAVSLLVAATGSVRAVPPRPLPSLARINALLDTARNLERKKDFPGVIPAYAGVLKECGDPAPRHLWHVAAKALVQTGSAQLALGRLDSAQAAYREALARYGSAREDVTRQYTLRARTLVVRVEELRQMITGTAAGASPPPAEVKPDTAPPEKEALVLITERTVDGSGDGTRSARGFEVTPLDGDTAVLMKRGERRASREGRKVLETGRNLVLVRHEIHPGSCWDYIDHVYNTAGYQEVRRKQVAKMPKGGPYLDTSILSPGDWLYYRNLSYDRIEHSAIFVEWIKPRERIALMLSYPGGNRREPARYRPYDLSNTYTVTRPKAQ
jgi:hypothetical protein